MFSLSVLPLLALSLGCYALFEPAKDQPSISPTRFTSRA